MAKDGEIGAMVLCGGHSRRMGRPKAWLPFGPGEVLLQRVVRLVGSVANAIVVVAAPSQELPELPSSVFVARDPVPDRGPMQGLAAGLAAMPLGVELVYVTGTDNPFFEPRWMDVLRRHIGNHDAAVPAISQRMHPLAALYRRSAITTRIEEHLRQNQLRIMALLDAIDCVFPPEDAFREVDPHLQTIANLNTPEDYRLAMEALDQDPK